MAGADTSRLKIAILLVLNGVLLVAIAHRARALRDAWRVHEMVVQSQAELAATGRDR